MKMNTIDHELKIALASRAGRGIQSGGVRSCVAVINGRGNNE
jgi:hypothetical protein